MNGAALLALLFSLPAMAFDIQGHRGARGHLPENTLPAFRLALEMGVDTLELDVGVTRDGVVVVHHDRRLNPDVARAAAALAAFNSRKSGDQMRPPTACTFSGSEFLLSVR